MLHLLIFLGTHRIRCFNLGRANCSRPEDVEDVHQNHPEGSRKRAPEFQLLALKVCSSGASWPIEITKGWSRTAMTAILPLSDAQTVVLSSCTLFRCWWGVVGGGWWWVVGGGGWWVVVRGS